MKAEQTALSGVQILTAKRWGDSRGWFAETWNARKLTGIGIDCDFVQDNESHSAQLHTLRGLHYQKPPRAQDKLVRCSRGAVLDVAVDARVGSPTYGKWVAVALTEENGRQLFIPKGFLHGFLSLSDIAEVQYKCSDFYAPECEGVVRWNSLKIDWQLHGAEPVLSAKDMHAPSFANWTSPFGWSEEK